MAVQLIQIGNVANDGTGDDLREAFIKVNQNFEELDLRDDEQTTASNLGFGAYDIFKQKVNYDLQFRGLVAGTDVTIDQSDSVLTINAQGGIKAITLKSDANEISVPQIGTLEFVGGNSINTIIVDDKMFINYDGPDGNIVNDVTPTLGGNLDANNFNITDVAILTATEIQADVTGLVHGIDIRDINVGELDLGGFSITVTTGIEFVVALNDLDYGSFTSPVAVDSDFGLFA
tara:strand:+ start:2199 stop:2894 length:696 start_codon:yes stop_codon:yes gene_type:complete